MSFAEQLKQARIARGLTQQQVAEQMGITNSTYCGYETGKRQPDVSKIKQLAIILNTSGDVLLETGIDEQIKNTSTIESLSIEDECGSTTGVYKVLQEIMDEKSLSIPDIARMCNLSDSTVRAIMVRKSKSVALEVAFKLSKGLNVSLERLNGETEKLTVHQGDELNPVQNELIEKIGKLSPASLAKLSELIDWFLAAQDKTQ